MSQLTNINTDLTGKILHPTPVNVDGAGGGSSYGTVEHLGSISFDEVCKTKETDIIKTGLKVTDLSYGYLHAVFNSAESTSNPGIDFHITFCFVDKNGVKYYADPDSSLDTQFDIRVGENILYIGAIHGEYNDSPILYDKNAPYKMAIFYDDNFNTAPIDSQICVEVEKNEGSSLNATFFPYDYVKFA